ncbi:MAG TPA: type IV toxin-antitoxin system AbiEi family antitoxin [Verrucomicrobiae bacterium]|nr:type IV toxin-antitoxin system AbiEi family antitoxin [Verrucomicrobiae bacterium]
MDFTVRTLSPQESRIVLALAEQKRREVGRSEIIKLLGVSAKAADNVIESLRRKGWLERASWEEYLVIPPEEGPDVLSETNLLALASRIADPYYIGYGSAAAHYGLTTQHRRVIFVVTSVRVRERQVGEGRVRVVNPKPGKFFGFAPVDVFGFKVMMSDREKTAIDCIDRPALVGGVTEAVSILATASRRFDWPKAAEYLERMDSTALVRRFGWVMDHVKADMPADIRERLLRFAARGLRTWMGPNPMTKVRGAIGYDKTWRLFVNVPRDELRESAGLGHRKALKKDA